MLEPLSYSWNVGFARPPQVTNSVHGELWPGRHPSCGDYPASQILRQDVEARPTGQYENWQAKNATLDSSTHGIGVRESQELLKRASA